MGRSRALPERSPRRKPISAGVKEGANGGTMGSPVPIETTGGVEDFHAGARTRPPSTGPSTHSRFSSPSISTAQP